MVKNWLLSARAPRRAATDLDESSRRTAGELKVQWLAKKKAENRGMVPERRKALRLRNCKCVGRKNLANAIRDEITRLDRAPKIAERPGMQRCNRLANTQALSRTIF